MAGVRTAALRGDMVGPTYNKNAATGVESFTFNLTDKNTLRTISVEWRDIWWIDEYPHAAGNTAQGQVAANLGQRTIWVLDTSAHVAAYLGGPLITGNPAGWYGPEVNYGVGPMGTTYPPCLCPK
jgi:hypothetical protein